MATGDTPKPVASKPPASHQQASEGVLTPKDVMPPAPAQDIGGTPVHISQAEQRKVDWRILKQLSSNIWPKGEWTVKSRVILSVSLLIAGKVLITLSHSAPSNTDDRYYPKVTTVQVPFLFKIIVDSLNVPMTASSTVWAVAGLSIVGCEPSSRIPSEQELIFRLNSLFLDGLVRICGTLFSEMRNAVFAKVAQRAVRKVARDTFDHLLNLDLKFHLERQTGGLTRAIDRGTK